ncbi:hypothetical protein ACIG5E_16880 [Kitasatospora sp. NPDC053057]|uniref:hypothetical protein n=1 Tax=Kitasatospora sp. NPDC053057 TaxID=3364062 RepID=UPI0037CCB1A4
MTQTSAAAPHAQLHVDCAPSPNPLPVSTPSKTKNGVLDLTFAKPDDSPDDIKCQAITVTLPVGTTDTDLASSATSVEANYEGQGTWRITKQATNHTVTFTCTPEAPGNPPMVTFDPTRRFTLNLSAIPVTRTPGNATLTITARTALTDDWETRPVSTEPVTKHQETITDFFFRSFSCEKPQVTNGGSVVLRWEGSEAGTEYWLSWDDKAPIKVTGRSHLSHTLTDTTTFVLDARTKAEDGATVLHHYLSTTVTVKDADIKAKTLTATDKVTVTDTFWADNKDSKKTWARSTTFEGDVTITGNNKLTVGGELEANGPIKANQNIFVDRGPAGKYYGVHTARIWALDGTSGGTVTVKSKIDFEGLVTAADGITIPSQKPLKADTIQIPDPAGSRKQVVFNSPVWIQEVALPTGTPAHLTVKGSVDVSKTLGVTGKSTLGEIQVNGAVDMFGTVQTLPSGTSVRSFTAPTSGILIGRVRQSSHYGFVSINIGGEWLTGGYNGNGGNCVTAAVRKGQTCSYYYQEPNTGGVFYWIPMGKNVSAVVAAITGEDLPQAVLDKLAGG